MAILNGLKEVSLGNTVIEVPDSVCCYETTTKCKFLQIKEREASECLLELGHPTNSDGVYIKPSNCLNLKEV